MAKRSQSKIVVGIPAYNEAAHIGSIVLKARQYAEEVIVVDDGSTDDTSEIARLAGATVIRREENKGKGMATQIILTEVKKRNHDVVVLLDADFQHNPSEIPNLAKPILEGYDLVIGSREAQANRTPRYRRIGQKILLNLTHILTGEKLTDSESGFRALSPKAISEIQLKENGFAVEAEIIARAADKHLKITQIPISNIYTKDGSTMNPVRHGVGVLIRILVMISQRRPLSFFGLGGSIMVTIGVIGGIQTFHLFSAKAIMTNGAALLSVLLIIIGIFSICTALVLYSLAERKG